MAKQKSGLGRGLGALFDDSSSLANNSSQSKHPEPQEKAVGGPTAQTEQSRAVSVSRETETSSTSPISREATPGSSSNIYISEDALEHAKVVSREARPKPHVNLTQSRTQQRPSVSRETQPHRPISQQSTVVSHDSPQQVKPSSKPGTPSIDKGDIGVVPLHKVTPNPDQPRTNFKKEEIEELAGSIKREGLLQPILVRKVGDAYQIIAGERRWQACKTLDMKEIPVRFWKADNDKALELALIENIQRSDLNPIEEAYGYKRLMERRGMTQSEVAQTVSKGRSTIANALRLLELPEEAQQLLFEDRITAGHARAILSIPDAAGRKTLWACNGCREGVDKENSCSCKFQKSRSRADALFLSAG